MKIYLASSWRNPWQPSVLQALRRAGHKVYDFTDHTPHPGDDTPETYAFSWSQVDEKYKSWSLGDYLSALESDHAERGFKADFDAMKWADACVLLLPCGRSAHLELGWFVGQGKPTFVLLSSEKFEADLMYKMCTRVFIHVAPLLSALKRADELLYEARVDDTGIVRQPLPETDVDAFCLEIPPGGSIGSPSEQADIMNDRGAKIALSGCLVNKGERTVVITVAKE